MKTVKYQIRKIRLSDVIKLRKLFIKALKFDFSYFPPSYLKKVNHQNNLIKLTIACFKPKRVLFGAWDNHQLIGYIIGDIGNKKLGQIFWLFVLPDYRGMQIGRSLINEALNYFKRHNAKRVELVTHDYKDYYLKQNFRLERTYPKLIGNIDMYFMVIDLSKGQ